MFNGYEITIVTLDDIAKAQNTAVHFRLSVSVYDTRGPRKCRLESLSLRARLRY
jgi:hypothetical protein